MSRNLLQVRRGLAVVLAASSLLLAAVWPLSLIRGFELTCRTIDGYPGTQMNVVEARRWPFVISRGRIWLLYARQDWKTPPTTTNVSQSPAGAPHTKQRVYGLRDAEPVDTQGWDAPWPLAVVGINWLVRPPTTSNIAPTAQGGTVVSSAAGACLPCWLLILLAGTAAWYLDARRWYPLWLMRRTRKGLCARCGYDMRATPAKCPECGAVPQPPPPYNPPMQRTATAGVGAVESSGRGRLSAADRPHVMRLRMIPGDQIIKRGSWLYDGSTPSAVLIARGEVFLGSGDHEDPPEVRDDRDVETFRVWFESPPGSDQFPTCGGQFLSIEDAVEGASKLLPSLPHWE